MSIDILALVPYSQTSVKDYYTGESYDYIDGKRVDVNWHLVIGKKWIDLGIKLPSWMQFNLSFTDGINKHGEICFKRCFGPDLEGEDDEVPCHYHFIKLPWYREAFKHGIQMDGTWFDVPLDKNSYTLADGTTFKVFSALENEADKKTFTFVAYGEVIKATVHAERYLDAVYWFPKWLKNLWHRERAFIELEFSEEIGKGRGSWKGGILGMNAAYKGSITDSWYNFRDNELKKIIEGSHE